MSGGMRRVEVVRPPMPLRAAEAMIPAATLDRVPPTEALGPDGWPYMGEVREEESGRVRSALAPGKQIVIVGLKRAWRCIGFMVAPGNLSGGTPMTAQLRVLVRGGARALSQQTFAIPTGGPIFYFGLQVGARCELVLTNSAAVTVTGIEGAIWGMNER